MKKFLTMAGLILLGLSSCQNEEVLAPGTGEETSVNITATLEGEAQKSRLAIDDTGDGAKADRCILQIYEKQGDQYVAYGDQVKQTVSGGKASFSNLRVISGKTYKFVFWADKGNNGADNYYNTADLTKISIKGDYAINTDDKDAFFGSTEIAVANATSQEVELRRPFGQINLTTKDLSSVAETSRPNKVIVTYTKAGYTTLNALTGDVVGDPATDVTTASTAVMDATGGYEVMDYLFAPATEEMLVDFSTEFLKDNTSITTESKTTNIPVRRNYRTNISGNFLTNGLDFDVIINPGFDGVYPQEYTSESALNAGGWWIIDEPQDGTTWSAIDLSKVNPTKDLYLTVNANVGTILVGNTEEISNHITIYVQGNVKTPNFITKGDLGLGTTVSTTVLNNLSIISESATPITDGFKSEELTTIKNVTFNGVVFKGKGISIGSTVSTLDGFSVLNSSATGLTESFVKVAAKGTSQNLTFKNNSIMFDSSVTADSDGRIDGFEIWYMNGGKLEISGNTQTGGMELVTSIPGAAQTSPDELIVENNTVSSKSSAITIQYPENSITIRNNNINIGQTGKAAVVFMLYKAQNNPVITVTGNTISCDTPQSGSSMYIMQLGGYTTEWGDNEAGSKATIVAKDNVKAGSRAKDWAGWFLPNGTATKVPITLNDGSDISTPYIN